MKLIRSIKLTTTTACACMLCGLPMVTPAQEKQPLWERFKKASDAKIMQAEQRTKPSPGSDRNSGEGYQAVTTKEDRFSGTATVKLQPEAILESPHHHLAMEAHSKLKGQRRIGRFAIDESVQLTFTSEAAEHIDFGDKELHFIVDGTPVNTGKTSGGVMPDVGRRATPTGPLKFRKQFFAVLDLSQLRKVASGRRVAMRLGSIEVLLSQVALNNLQQFVSAASQKE